MQALRGNVATGQLLLKHGAPVSARDSQLTTPLHCAAAYGRADMCRMLLDNGADGGATDINGDTPLDMAIDYKRHEAALLLLDLGCPCAKHDAAKAAEESVWVPDPLWPHGYKKHLFVAEGDEEGDTDTDELVEQLYRIGQEESAGAEAGLLDAAAAADDGDGGEVSSDAGDDEVNRGMVRRHSRRAHAILTMRCAPGLHIGA